MTAGSRPASPRWPAGLAWSVWGLTIAALVATAWLDRLLRQAGRAGLAVLSAGSIPLVAAVVSAVTVGAVLAARRPGNPVGWLLLGLGLSQALHDLTYSYTRYGLVARPGSLPAAAYLGGLNNGLVLTWISCAGFVLLLTPTGKLPSPRWRWWARITAAGAVAWLVSSTLHPAPLRPEYPAVGNPLAVPALVPLLDAAAGFGALAVLLGLVVGAVSLVLRFRRARGTERLQLRWLAWAAMLASLALLVALAGLVLDDSFTVLGIGLGVSAAVLPLATGAAILRYRLYDIDRIISRTLAYALLTILLGLGYALVVLGLGRLLPDDSSLTVAAATLAAAAAFQPARRRTQQLVDRRFNRRRYDAAQTIQTFSARLRDQVDLEALTDELLVVVHQTIQPTRASLWLRPRPAAGTTAVPGPPAG